MASLSALEARRIALAAQGFGNNRPADRLGPSRILRVAERLGAFQIDSVNVLVRSHYLPAFSRLGPYRLDLLDELAYQRRALFEYWGHQASLIPVGLFPFFRHQMEFFANLSDSKSGNQEGLGDPVWLIPKYRTMLSEWASENRNRIEAVYREVTERGPISAGELKEPGKRRGPWWGWSEGKTVLEWLFRTGKVTIAARRNFERIYDLTERVLPPKVLAADVPAEEARNRLVMIAAGALGVATAEDIAYYFFLRPAEAKRRVATLAAEGLLEETSVEGWRGRAYVPAGLHSPGRISAQALISPFDSLIWERKRTARLFGFDYRIEIYTPAAKRRHGYYVLPFLVGDRLSGRVDLKADRASKTLLVQAAHIEPGEDPSEVLPALANELSLVAEWLGLDSVWVAGRGKLQAGLRKLVA